jgi:iron(III) transport system permease protein
VVLLLAIFVLWPVAKVLLISLSGPGGLTLAHYAEFFGSWRLLRILLQSLLVSAVSTVITVALALVLAYAVTRTTVPGKRFISLMSLVPLISPPFLVSLAFILLLGRNGLVTHGLGLTWNIYGFQGIVISRVFTFLPRAYLLLANVLGNIDTALEAAGDLGAGPLTTLSRDPGPGAAGVGLGRPHRLHPRMTDFGNPILIGGRYNVLATEIYRPIIGMNNFAAGATMSAVLLVPCLVAYLVSTYWVGTGSYVTVTAGPAALRPTPAYFCAGPSPWWRKRGVVHRADLRAHPARLVRAPVGRDWTLSLPHYAFQSTAEGAGPSGTA